jgi:hypothetical protein
MRDITEINTLSQQCEWHTDVNNNTLFFSKEESFIAAHSKIYETHRQTDKT